MRAREADPTDNHRWVYVEGDYQGSSPLTVGQDAPWPLTIYHVAVVLAATDAPDAVPQPPNLPAPCHCAPAPRVWPWAAAAGLVAGLGGWWLGAKVL